MTSSVAAPHRAPPEVAVSSHHHHQYNILDIVVCVGLGQKQKNAGQIPRAAIMARSGRGKRWPSYDGSTTAVLQGTHNSGDPPIFSPGVGETVKGGSDDKRKRARIFDHKRVSVIGVIFAIIVSVAAVGSIGFAKPPSNFSTSTSTPPHPTEDGVPHL